MRERVCKYFPCPVAKETGRDCADFGDCQAKRFYDKYTINQEEMECLGVGAPMVALERLGYGGIEGEADSQKCHNR